MTFSPTAADSSQQFYGEIPAWECWTFLETHTIGRVCVTADGYPLAFPVTYRVLGGEAASPAVLFRTRPGNTIGRSLGAASFEVDEIDLLNRDAVSVIVRGDLRPAEGWAGLPDPHPWITAGRDAWMVVTMDSISGRRLKAAMSSDVDFSVEWAMPSSA
jgi:Pyridoxamine 5'-phosphate oxidase